MSSRLSPGHNGHKVGLRCDCVVQRSLAFAQLAGSARMHVSCVEVTVAFIDDASTDGQWNPRRCCSIVAPLQHIRTPSTPWVFVRDGGEFDDVVLLSQWLTRCERPRQHRRRSVTLATWSLEPACGESLEIGLAANPKSGPSPPLATGKTSL